MANVQKTEEGRPGLIFTDKKTENPDHRAGEQSGWDSRPGTVIPKFMASFSITTACLLKPLNSTSSNPWGLVGGAGHRQQHPLPAH